MAGCRIEDARGILNGATHDILSQMETGLDFGAALARVQELGYAERDPTADVDGWDAAGNEKFINFLKSAFFQSSRILTKFRSKLIVDRAQSAR